MTEASTLQEKAAETLRNFKKKVNLEEAKRIVRNGRAYVKTHPGTALAVTAGAGFLIGYVARAITDHRRRASA